MLFCWRAHSPALSRAQPSRWSRRSVRPVQPQIRSPDSWGSRTSKNSWAQVLAACKTLASINQNGRCDAKAVLAALTARHASSSCPGSLRTVNKLPRRRPGTMAERQPLTSEQRKEIAKRRRRKKRRPQRWNQSSPPSPRNPYRRQRSAARSRQRKDGPLNSGSQSHGGDPHQQRGSEQAAAGGRVDAKAHGRAGRGYRKSFRSEAVGGALRRGRCRFEAGLRRNEDAASSHPTARSSHPTSRTDPMASSRAYPVLYPASQYSSESDMARVNRPAGRVSSPDACPPSICSRTGRGSPKPSEDQRDRARATAAVERAKRKPSEEVKAKARQAAEARRIRDLEQASLSRPSLEQGSLSRPSLQEGSLSRPSVASGSLAQPSIASDMAVKHNLQEASVSERRAEELARRAKLVREVERAQADVAATAERVSTRSRNEVEDEFGATPLPPRREA